MNAYGPVQYVELFHLLLLDQLGRKLDKRHFALKGGCNLRFFLKSIRYSEDMDLDAQTVPPDVLQERVRLIPDSKPFSRSASMFPNLKAPRLFRWSGLWKSSMSKRGSSM